MVENSPQILASEEKATRPLSEGLLPFSYGSQLCFRFPPPLLLFSQPVTHAALPADPETTEAARDY